MRIRDQDGLFRHGLLLLAAAQVGNAANLLFHIIMGRTLSVREYGVMVSMMGCVLVLGMPMDAVRTALAHFTSRLKQENNFAGIKALAFTWCRRLIVVTVVLVIGGIILSGEVVTFFHLDSRTPVFLTMLILIGTLFIPVFAGVLQGVQAFIWMSVVAHSWGVVRLLLGGLAVVSIAAVAEAGLGAQAVGVGISLAAGIIGFRQVIGPTVTAGNRPPGTYRYLSVSALMIAAFAVLMNADVSIVKHYFDPDQAGLFARAATIGRIVVFLPMPIAYALFPKVVSGGGTTPNNWRTLIRAIVFSFVLIACAVGACSCIPGLPLSILYRDHTPQPDMIRLVQMVIWAMSPLGLTYLLLNFELAQNRFYALAGLSVCVAGYLVGVAIWHASLQQIAVIMACVNSASLMVMIVALLRHKAKPASGINDDTRQDDAAGTTRTLGDQRPCGEGV